MNEKENELLIRLDERTEKIQMELREIKQKLFGNGQPGLCKRLDVLETSQSNIKYGVALGFAIMGIVIGFLKIFQKI